jgi:hypothetical protein
MDIRRIEESTTPILRCTTAITRVDDALLIISACYENDAGCVLLHEDILPAAFFELQTRFAGEFVQKLVNYRIRIAAVFAKNETYSERFREYVAEARGGNQFRTFADEASALRWLEGVQAP